jgi:hypothetical protein
MGLVRRPVGDVDARLAVEVEPVARELERRPLAGLEPEHVAVERLRRLEVVGKHEQMVEPTEH